MGCGPSSPDQVKTVWYHEFIQTLPQLEGKRIAITGTTTGTGSIAALACARLGAEVILLNRASERAVAYENKLKEQCPQSSIHSVACDMMDFASVRNAAQQVQLMCEPGGLDVLACNAGIMAFPDERTGDGFDVQMQTNHLSHFLLVNKLMPLLRETAKDKGEARIVHQSSAARFGTPLERRFFQQVDKLGGNSMKACMERYHQSKLANSVFALALADKLIAKEENVLALSSTPGMAATSIIANSASSFLRCATPIMLKFVQSAEDGTMGLMKCIAAADVKNGDLWTPSTSGRWRESKGPLKVHRRPLQPQGPNAVIDSKEAQELLWKESETATGESFDL